MKISILASSRIIALLTLSINFSALKSQAAEYTFRSSLDKFTVEVEDGVANYRGKNVSEEPFRLIKPLFDYKLGDLCADKLGKPDLTITRKSGENEIKRLVYIEKKVVSDAEGHCGEVSGQGLYELPLHHNWFIDNKSVTIGLGSSFSIWKNNKLVVEFEKRDGRWRNKDNSFFVNWSFFDKFAASMREIPIDFRVNKEASKVYASFELRQENRVFKFVKVREKTWAVQFPNTPWYAASGQFGFFDDMTAEVWISPHAKLLKILADPSANTNKRISAVRSLSDQWGTDIKFGFFSVLETKGENPDVLREIANVLRRKPSDDNYGTLVETLRLATDLKLQNHISRILQIRNPSGPRIEEDDSATDVRDKISKWVAWRKTIQWP